MKYIDYKYCTILCLLILNISCQKEIARPPDPPVGKEINLFLNLYKDKEESRSMNTEEESRVDEVDVLVFKEGYFSQRAKGSNNGMPPNTFEVKLTTNNADNNSLVVITNSREMIDQLEANNELYGFKSTILRKIEFSIEGTDHRWPANLTPNQEIRPIPMWGEIDNIKIDNNLKQELENKKFQLYRALARVDVRIDPSVTNFVLTDLYFYRYNTKGCVVPGPEAKLVQHPVNDNEMRVDKVTIPTSAQPEKNFLHYPINSENSSVGSIYVMEVERAADNDFENATCIIVGGKYNNSNTVTYYRADFEIIWHVRNQSGQTPEDVVIIEAGRGELGSSWRFARMLRNHIYDLKVVKVTREGASSPEAARSEPNIEFKVETAAWTDRSLNIEFD